MTAIVRFIANNALWFYFVCIAGIAVLFLVFIRARQSSRQALFGLELEVAATRRQSALRLMLLIGLFAVVIAFISAYLEPNLPAETLPPSTVTPDFFATPPPTFTNITPAATATLTATLTTDTAGTPDPALPAPAAPDQGESAEETPTPAPVPLVIPGSVCFFTGPAEGSTVGGEVTFSGSANAKEFMFYKLEAYGPETNGVWASILGNEVGNPVSNGFLGTVNFGGWTPGGYSIRMVVVDNTSNEVATCYISLNITLP